MTGFRGRVAARVVDGAYALGWALVKALPERVVLGLFAAGADLAARRRGKGVLRLEANLARVVPGATGTELRELTRQALRSYARYWCEVFRLPSMDPERIVAGHLLVGEDRWLAARARPEGVILALPHSGNWDLAGAFCGLVGFPFTTVAERLEPEALFSRFLAFRASLGMEVLPLTGGGQPPGDVLRARLDAGGNLALVADRDLSRNGVDVTFFGAAARMPAGPASLALQTGATLIPVTLRNEGPRWHVTFHEPVPHSDVATMTQALADVFEAGIASAPQDWHMLQRFWLDDLDVADPRRTAPA
ncbi:MAG: lipid biosynthesis acyltransferase [Frankiales bacterium]|nr:lipid biosynthesis acyltransferase [Frankiales bacterium]